MIVRRLDKNILSVDLAVYELVWGFGAIRVCLTHDASLFSCSALRLLLLSDKGENVLFSCALSKRGVRLITPSGDIYESFPLD